MPLNLLTTEHLTTLFVLCKSDASWYGRLAGSVEEGASKAALQRCALQRQRFASALQGLLERELGQAAVTAAVAGHTSEPTQLQSATYANLNAVAHLCEQKDEALVAAYGRALDAQMDAYVEPIILTQFQKLIEAYDEMRMRSSEAGGDGFAYAAA